MNRIFIVCHRASEVPSDEVYTPIAVGTGEEKAELAKIMLSDDEGENIADKNGSFNELTAIYWVWKHLDKFDADFIGISHYRRYFSFGARKHAYYEFDGLEECRELIDVTSDGLDVIMKNCDFIVPAPTYRRSVYDNYKAAHRVEDLDLAVRILLEAHPEYTAAAEKYLTGTDNYFFNMFIFDRATFERYCEWIFPVLFRYEKECAHPSERMFVTERLAGIFITELLLEGKRALRLPTVFIREKRPTFRSALRAVRGNFRKSDCGFIYAVKPLVIYFIPKRLMTAYRRRQYKRAGRTGY